MLLREETQSTRRIYWATVILSTLVKANPKVCDGKTASKLPEDSVTGANITA